MPWDEEVAARLRAGIRRLLEEISNPEDGDAEEPDAPPPPESDDALGVGPDVLFEAFDSGSGDLLVRGTNLATGAFGRRHFIPLEAEGFARTAVRSATLRAAGWLVTSQWTAVCNEAGHALYEFAGVARTAKKRLRLVPTDSPARVNMAGFPRGEDSGAVTKATTVAESLERRVMDSSAFPIHNVIRRLRDTGGYGGGRMLGGQGPEVANRLRELDSHTYGLRVFSPRLVPGLLQTERYAFGAVHAHRELLPPQEKDLWASARWQRSVAWLTRWEQMAARAHANFVIGEAAFRYPITAPHVHVEQIEWLLDLSRKSNITIQILPNVIAPPTEGPFNIHELAGGARVGWGEAIVGGWYATSREELATLYSASQNLINTAYDRLNSRSYMREALAYWTKAATAGTEQSSASPATPTQDTVSPWPVRKVGPSQ